MTIDWSKCYNAIESSAGDTFDRADMSYVSQAVRQAVKRYVTEYHRQLEEQLADRHISHLHLAHGLTEEAARAKPETCDCENRKILEKGGWLRPAEANESKGFKHYLPHSLGNWAIYVCPFCRKSFPKD